MNRRKLDRQSGLWLLLTGSGDPPALGRDAGGFAVRLKDPWKTVEGRSVTEETALDKVD